MQASDPENAMITYRRAAWPTGLPVMEGWPAFWARAGTAGG